MVKNTNKSLPKQTNLKTRQQKHRKKENAKNKYLNYFSNEKEQSRRMDSGREGGRVEYFREEEWDEGV